jgi:hypothetical protein
MVPSEDAGKRIPGQVVLREYPTSVAGSIVMRSLAPLP